MNTGQEALELQSGKVNEIEASLKAIKEIAKAAESKANAATSQVNDLKAKLLEVNKQLKANK
jgi:hypothetical protein